MKTIWRIRTAGTHDLLSMHGLMREDPQAPAWDVRALRAFLGHDAGAQPLRAAWVADEPGGHELLGFIAGSLLRLGNSAACELEYLVVADRARRRRLGGQLLGTFLDWARSSAAETVDLEVRAGNEPALALYRSAGFRETGRRAAYYSSPEEDASLMRLDLTR